MYPYKLAQNPYPSSPTPTTIDAKILGGKKHKEAKSAVLSCIGELLSKITETPTDKDFRLITLIQDVGSGKTHLSLHIRDLQELSDNTVISYVDLSQISPRDMHSLYRSMLGGFTDDYVRNLKESVVYFLRDQAERNIMDAKKIFNYGFIDLITRRSLTYKAEQILQNKIVPNYLAINSVLKEDFSQTEISILKLLIEGKFRADAYNVSTLEDIIASISAIASLNLKFLKKLTIFQIDEFDSDKESIDFVKAVINAHLPSTVLMLILTPSSYEEIRNKNSSVFDRLEKANYKIDLAGSNTLEEILDICLEYIRYYDCGNNFTKDDEKDLTAKIKVIYDEFPDFRNIRSMINILYHATENAVKRNAVIIDEEAIDDTIEAVYPGLRIKGSIMGVPLSDFFKIRRNSDDVQMLESDVRDAVRNLVNYAYEIGTVAKPEAANGKGNGIGLIYDDPNGTKVAVAVVISKDYVKSFKQISNAVKSADYADKLVVLTNTNAYGESNGTSIVNIDRYKMIDLIYFSSKYRNKEMVLDDSQRALMLAKSIKLC
ncbi:MAG TPA: hypothetical protein VFJ05_04130 [Nitrososphaeraceae archaeon]|nr:hypothetical protein [Nitrososphaeraceae archaeon]